MRDNYVKLRKFQWSFAKYMSDVLMQYNDSEYSEKI